MWKRKILRKGNKQKKRSVKAERFFLPNFRKWGYNTFQDNPFNKMNEDTQKGELGVISGIIIVVLVLIAGAFYFYNQRLERQKQIQSLYGQTEEATTTLETEQ